MEKIFQYHGVVQEKKKTRHVEPCTKVREDKATTWACEERVAKVEEVLSHVKMLLRDLKGEKELKRKDLAR